MSLGTYNNTNNNKNNYSPVTYSAYKMSNAESEVDQTAISFSFWNNMLKISIAPRKQNSSEISFDFDNAVVIYLSHTKARILYEEICNFQNNPGLINAGVPSGSALITICNGKEFGVTTPCLVIRKVNAETGATEASYAYQFKAGYHYGIRNYNQNDGSFDKVSVDYDNLEVEQFKTLLLEYYKAMTGAVAYSVIDQMKYDVSRFNTKCNLIAEKLGVEFRAGGEKAATSKSSTSYFNNANKSNSMSASSYKSIAASDIESQFE